MHVIHVIDALAIGGAERMLVEIANRTVHDGHRATVCVTRADTTLAHRLDPAIELLVLGRRRTMSIRPVSAFVRWIRDERPDVIHAHGRSTFSLIALLRAAGAVRVPVLIHDHKGIEIDASVPRWMPIAARTAAAYVGVYPMHASWARRAGFPPDRIHVIPNALDLTAIAARYGTSDRPTTPGDTLVFVGGLREEKSVEILLEAMARVRSTARLLVIGGDVDPGYARRCRERSRQPDLSGRVEFLGARDDAMTIAAGADLAVHPAWSESGPLVLLEYAALALPFVATEVGGIASGLAEAGAGVFVRPHDPVALAAAIEEVLELTGEERSRRGRASRELARERYDIASVMPRWYSVYEAIRR